MIQTLKQIKNRIRSTENTQKVTSAMEMVSVAKLNRIGKKLHGLGEYVFALSELMYEFINSQDGLTHPFFKARERTDKICLCLITADSSLCGAYNNNIIRFAEQFINQHGKERVSLVCVGRKGFNYFKKYNLEILNTYIGMNGRYSEKIIQEVENNLINTFVSGKVAQIYIAYTHAKTALVHKPTIEKYLNIEYTPTKKIDYILEPDRGDILDEIIPKYISMKLRLIILNAFSAEHSSRTVAMKTATDNAKELLQSLVLLRNKVRQASITQELLEIISSSEALRG
ncbi:MAG: ATP synthase F1 subunit gamma [Candidatus Omnitrophica bacterium]|nr:ATP synthase F1 subunit gamma [Candidatus Omnitrophota bacterium]